MQWRHNGDLINFAEQCAIQECEAQQLDFIINDISIQLSINRKNEPKNTSKFQPQGKFTASFGGMNGQSMMPMCMHWNDEKKNRMGFSVSDRFKFCIQSLADRVGFKKILVTGYTTLKVYEKDCMQPVMYYATEYVSGGKRYDYANGRIWKQWWKSCYLSSQNNRFCLLR